ncbi:MAG: GHKL domain-containing protein [Flavobacteriales bacterium]|nr:GHKL domain-containing protein [Flavobacteriales bacterium]
MKNNCFFYLILLVFLFHLNDKVNANSIEQIQIFENDSKKLIGKSVYYLEDKKNIYSIDEVIASNLFIQSDKNIPNFGVTQSSYWIRFTISNNTNKELFMELAQPIMDEIEFYNFIDSTNMYEIKNAGEIYPFSKREFNFTNYVFNLNIRKGETKTYYVKIKSTEQIQAPIYIGSLLNIAESSNTFLFYSALFLGIMTVMILYNFFIYLTTKDKSYIFYVLYISTLMFTQLCPKGITFQYFWPNLPWLAVHSMFILPSLVGIFGIFFFNNFLKTKEFLPIASKIFNVIILVYIVVLSLAFIKKYETSYMIMELTAMIVSLLMLLFAVLILRKGYQPARYFLIAWSLFLSGIFLWVLKDLGVLPYNSFTNNSMQIGAAVETVLLSFALGARINSYKKEKEISQKLAFEALEEKEQLVREQNIILEQKVEDRTKELNQTLHELKETQTQLVDSEKMASLGQLTAGVAHEINNPINFVSSNIPPLKQDIEDLTTIIDKYSELKNSTEIGEKLQEIEALKNSLDYNYLKEELQIIISGIENGAKRTTEIVSGLKNFSRMDESDLQLADINEGINSTLVILKSSLNNIQLEMKLNPLPKIECYPGKLNQVFMNLINNSIQAIEENKSNITKGIIAIETLEKEDSILILIADNGIGMNKDTQKKIFDPFFTTKKVGQGTGLGLSIVYTIIQNHQGKIEVQSNINEGCVFIIILPKKLSN